MEVAADNLASLKVKARWMIRRDIPEVLEIERQSFEFPWLAEEIIRCIRQRNIIGMVVEHAKQVVGFVIYEIHKTRLHVLNFAVHPDSRRRLVGSQLVNVLMTKINHQRRTCLTLEIRETNLIAQMFFKKHGFRCTKVMHDFYSDSPEDAYFMQRLSDDLNEWDVPGTAK